jgi:hypothetical protein
MSISLAPARAAASRRNGAKSRGPRSAEGKARTSQNALKHGLCAQKHLVADEDAHAFAALEATLLDELAPEGVLQRLLAGRVVRAAWRLERAERIETELLAYRKGGEDSLALALIRDGNGTRSIDTLMRYRGSAQAEFYRALRTLKELQAEAASATQPDEPETRGNAGESKPRRPEQGVGPLAPAVAPSEPRNRRRARRNEPESRADAGPPPRPGRRAA